MANSAGDGWTEAVPVSAAGAMAAATLSMDGWAEEGSADAGIDGTVPETAPPEEASVPDIEVSEDAVPENEALWSGDPETADAAFVGGATCTGGTDGDACAAFEGCTSVAEDGGWAVLAGKPGVAIIGRAGADVVDVAAVCARA